MTSGWLHRPHGDQKGNWEPPFSRDKNPEDRRLTLERGDKTLERAELGKDQGVPGTAKARDGKPDLGSVGAGLAGVRASPGPRLALRLALCPVLSPGPIPAPTW